MLKKAKSAQGRRKPARAQAHPGAVLRRKFMDPLGLSANALALGLRVPVTRIGDLLKARRAITADTALRLARYFGTTPEYWLNLQTAYDLSRTSAERGALIARDVYPHAA
jgi:addiction module HigA family antidote